MYSPLDKQSIMSASFGAYVGSQAARDPKYAMRAFEGITLLLCFLLIICICVDIAKYFMRSLA